MRVIAEVLEELGRSDFRRKQKLSDQDLTYLHDRGIDAVRNMPMTSSPNALLPHNPKMTENRRLGVAIRYSLHNTRRRPAVVAAWPNGIELKRAGS